MLSSRAFASLVRRSSINQVGGEGMAAATDSGCTSCSVCLDQVGPSEERSMAKLKCGHIFHLDCIGSAFNAKGSMQCPNCRFVEDGQWLYGHGYCHELHQDDFFIPGTPGEADDEMIDDWQDFILNSHPHIFATFEESAPPLTEYPDPGVNHLRILHGNNPVASTSINHYPLLPPYWTPTPVDVNLNLVQNQVVPPRSSGGGGGGGGGIGGNIMGPQSFAIHERTGWPSPHIPFGTMTDVGLTSLPIHHFRWSAHANRSEVVHSEISGWHISPESHTLPDVHSNGYYRPPQTHATPLHIPCGPPGSSNAAPPFVQASGPARRSRQRRYRNLVTGDVRAATTVAGNSSATAGQEVHHSRRGSSQRSNGNGWQQQQQQQQGWEGRAPPPPVLEHLGYPVSSSMEVSGPSFAADVIGSGNGFRPPQELDFFELENARRCPFRHH